MPDAATLPDRPQPADADHTRGVRDLLSHVSLVASLLVAGLHAGFFLTYEISITPAMALLDNTTYATTFQAINEAVRTPTFMVIFAGAAPLTALALYLLRADPLARVLLGVALLAHVAVVAITVGGSIPLNERLADVAITDDTATTARLWFETRWNAWNLARTIATVGAFTATCTALVRRRNPQRT